MRIYIVRIFNPDFTHCDFIFESYKEAMKVTEKWISSTLKNFPDEIIDYEIICYEIIEEGNN